MATSWTAARKQGYGVTYGVRLDGIPYDFLEPMPHQTAATGTAINSPNGDTLSYALAVFDGQRVSVELDRQTGIATGRALDITLGWDALEDESLTTTLFSEPSDTALLTTDHTSSVGTITVDSTSGWPSSGGLYLGLEYVTYTGVTTSPDTFTGCTRGASGLAHAHLEASPGFYRQATDVPRHWRGRLVTLYEHLTAPDGRLVNEDVNSVGTYCREVWRGYVDEHPRPTARGMTLRCLPLCRLGEREIGREVTARIWTGKEDDGLDAPLYTTEEDRLSFSVLKNGGGSSSTAEYWDASGATSARVFAKRVATTLSSLFSAESWAGATPLVTGKFFRATGGELGGPRVLVAIHRGSGANQTEAASCAVRGHWFIPDGTYNAAANGQTNQWQIWLPFIPGWAGTGWLPILLDENDEFNAYTVPSSGFLLIKTDGVNEIAYYDSVVSLSFRPRAKLLHVARRHVGGTGSDTINPWIQGGEVSLIAGHTGPLHEVIRTVLTSSGEASLRGTYDTLGTGFGFGLPDSLVDTTTLETYPLDDQHAMAVTDGKGSLEDLIGGWLVLYRRCLAQVRQSSAVKLTVVSTWPADADDSDTLDDTNVLVDTTAAPDRLDAPNRIRLTTTALDDGAPLILHSVPRIQAEGVTEWEIKAPGADGGVGLEMAQGLMARSYGLSTIALTVPCWVDVQPGDAVSLEIAHPLVYDWAAGARSPSQIDGRVLGWELDLVSGDQRLTVLYGGAGRYLCPAVVISSKTDSKNFDMASADEAARFTAGETVTIYTPGNEASEETTDTIDTISGVTITFTNTQPSWVGAGSVITHAPYASASTRQRGYAYVEANTRWL